MKGNVNKHRCSACSDFPLWVSLTKKKKNKKIVKKLPKKILKKKLPKAAKKIVVNRHLIVPVNTKYSLTQPIDKN